MAEKKGNRENEVCNECDDERQQMLLGKWAPTKRQEKCTVGYRQSSA